MPKIQNVGIGNYIRSHRHHTGVLQIAQNNGDSFLCYVVTGKESTRVIVDTTKFFFINNDTQVEQVSI